MERQFNSTDDVAMAPHTGESDAAQCIPGASPWAGTMFAALPPVR